MIEITYNMNGIFTKSECITSGITFSWNSVSSYKNSTTILCESVIFESLTKINISLIPNFIMFNVSIEEKFIFSWINLSRKFISL